MALSVCKRLLASAVRSRSVRESFKNAWRSRFFGVRAPRKTVLSWGSSWEGQLGHGFCRSNAEDDEVYEEEPVEIEFFDSLLSQASEDSIPSVFAGDRFSYVVVPGQGIYSFGNGEYGQTGHKETTATPISVSVPEESIHQKVSISCGRFHSLLLLEGTLFSTGSANHGATGHPSKQSVTLPTKIASTESIHFNKIGCGWFHSFAVDEKNELWAWGSGMGFVLGRGDEFNVRTPKRVASILDGQSIAKITGGLYHSVAVVVEGHTSQIHRVYTWGVNTVGQLGRANK